MRVVLADIKGGEGFIGKDTVAGGYGSRLRPFSRVTRVISFLKRRFHDVPSVHLAYLAALAAEAGHEVRYTHGELVEGDVALVLSSIVDFRRESAFADAMRTRGVRVGFVGLAATKMPELFRDHADFIFAGEPEAAFIRLLAGEVLDGIVDSPRDRRPRQLALPEMGSRVGAAPATRHPVFGPAGGRRIPAAGQPRVPGVLHVLPAPDSGRLPLAVGRSHSR